MDCFRKRRKRFERGLNMNMKRPLSGTGPEINPIPNSIGLTFGERALCPQGPAGLPSFCWNRLHTEARFWEKKRGGVKKMKMARMMGIPRHAFKKVIAFMRTKSIPFLLIKSQENKFENLVFLSTEAPKIFTPNPASQYLLH